MPSPMLTPEDYARDNAPFEQPRSGDGPAAPDGPGPAGWRPPLPGIMRRALAFILDFILLTMCFTMLERVARPALLNLNPWLPWLAWLIAFLYFFLGTGPLGRGRTLGKLSLHLRIVGRDGEPLGTAAALRRELLRACVLLLPLGQTPFYPALIFPPEARYPLTVMLTLLSLTALALLITLTLATAIDPFKRGWHDRIAGSYVTFYPTPDSFRELMAARPDGAAGARWLTWVTLAFFVISTAALALMPLRALTRDDTRALMRQQDAMRAELELGAYELVQLVPPDPMTRAQLLKVVAELRRGAAEQKKDVPTTDSLLARAFIDGETAVGIAMRTRGAYQSGEVDTLLGQAEHLRAMVWEASLAEGPRTAAEGSTATQAMLWPERPQRFALLLYEPLQMLLNNGVQLRGRISGPADPDAGPLTASEIAPPEQIPLLPKNAGAQTSTTLSQSPPTSDTLNTPAR